MTFILLFVAWLSVTTRSTITEASSGHESVTHEPVEYVPKTCPAHSGLLICCDGVLWSKSVGSDCCGKLAYNKTTGECCDYTFVARPPLKCCGTKGYNPAFQQCCDRTPAPLGPKHLEFQCCGHFSYNTKIQQCCGGIPEPLGTPAAPLLCCAIYYYNPKISICCADHEHTPVIAITTPNGCNSTVGQLLNFVLPGKVVHESHSVLGALSASHGG